MSSKRITAIVADDEADFCKVVRNFAKLPNLTFLPDVYDGEEALDTIVSLQPDIAILDIQMPGRSGPNIAEEIVRRKLKTQVLLITAHKRDDYFDPTFWSSAMGMFYKPDITDSYGFSDTLHQAFRALSKGRPYISPTVLDAIRASASATRGRDSGTILRKEEWEVLNYVIRGLTDKEVADRLDVSIKTIERRKRSMRLRVGVRTTSELVAYVINLGLTSRANTK